jgi:hypothetical protein
MLVRVLVVFGFVPNCRIRYDNGSAQIIALYPTAGILGRYIRQLPNRWHQMDDLLGDAVRNRRMLCICYIFLRCGLSSEGRNQ